MKPNTPVPTNFSTFPRRDFLKGILAAGAVSVVTPHMLLAAQNKGAGSNKKKSAKPKSAAKKHAGEKIRVAGIGFGNRGREVLERFDATGLATIVALCDVDFEGTYAKRVIEMFPEAPRFQDFRKMFDKMGSQIEAVVIATPDHSHFPIAMLAMSLGKHVFVEKPMAHSFLQIQLLMDAAKRHNVVTQMGNQGHSEGNYFQFKAWTEAGIIRDVTRITAWMNSSRRGNDSEKFMFSKIAGYLPGQPVPDSLDWDNWLATAIERAYNIGYTRGDWRSWFAFGNGTIGDWGAHILDTAHEFLDLGLPTRVEALKVQGHNQFVFPQGATIAFHFPARGAKPPVDLTWYDGHHNRPTLPSDMGELVRDPNLPPAPGQSSDASKMNLGKIIYGKDSDGKDLLFKGGSHGATLEIIPKSRAREMASRLPGVPKSPSDHFANFLLACQKREEARSPFSLAGPLCQFMALGVIAQRLNVKLEFDRATKQITNNKLANAMLAGDPPRKGWEQYYRM